ncbi:MAG: hypothetical protein QOC85_3887 [Streptomyces sp.]|nr:hypothetical protein [Streptomyces sp.]
MALIAAGVLAAAGCGEGTKPETVATQYVGTNAATKCDVLSTQLVEQLTGKRGAAALATCRRNVVRFSAPKDVRIRSVKAEGGDAGKSAAEREKEKANGEAAAHATEAEVQLVADGKEAELRLAKQDGEWRIVQLGE